MTNKPQLIIQEKICSKCKKHKLLTEFYKDKTKPLGVKYQCKTCSIEYARSDARKVYMREYAKTDKAQTYYHNYRKSAHGKRKVKECSLRNKYNIKDAV